MRSWEELAQRINRGQRWTVSDYCEQDEDEVLRLRAEVFGEPISRDEWRWKYRAAPGLEPVRLVARDTKTRRLIGFNATIALPLSVGGTFRKIYSVVDSMVHSSFWNTGLYVDLSMRVVRKTGDLPDALPSGLPNNRAFSVWLKLGMPCVNTFRLSAAVLNWASLCRGRLGWRPLETAVGFLLNLLVARPLSCLWSGRTDDVRVVGAFPTSVEGMTERALSAYPVHIHRTAAQLNRRYADHPGRPYRIFLQGPESAPCGYLIVAITEKKDLRLGALVDFVFDKNATDGAALLNAGMTYLAGQKADVVVALSSVRSMTSGLLRRKGFLSSRLLWSNRPYHFVVSRIRMDNPNEERYYDRVIKDPKNWFFTFGDTDLF